MKRELTSILASGLTFALALVAFAKDAKQDARELENAKRGLGTVKLSVVEAIQSAMKKVQGGKAVQADFQIENNRPRFKIEIINTSGKHMEVNVDAVTGTVGEAAEEKMTSATNMDDEKAEEAASKGKVTLVKAIETAQNRVPNGKAFGARSEMIDGEAVFTLKFLADDKVVKVHIDCDTDEVLDVNQDG